MSSRKQVGPPFGLVLCSVDFHHGLELPRARPCSQEILLGQSSIGMQCRRSLFPPKTRPPPKGDSAGSRAVYSHLESEEDGPHSEDSPGRVSERGCAGCPRRCRTQPATHRRGPPRRPGAREPLKMPNQLLLCVP